MSIFKIVGIALGVVATGTVAAATVSAYREWKEDNSFIDSINPLEEREVIIDFNNGTTKETVWHNERVVKSTTKCDPKDTKDKKECKDIIPKPTSLDEAFKDARQGGE